MYICLKRSAALANELSSTDKSVIEVFRITLKYVINRLKVLVKLIFTSTINAYVYKLFIILEGFPKRSISYGKLINCLYSYSNMYKVIVGSDLHCIISISLHNYNFRRLFKNSNQLW